MANHTFQIWQIPGTSPDFRDYAFEDYQTTVKRQGGADIPRERYKLVWTEAMDSYPAPDDIYYRFNTDHPEAYRGRSLSVGDLVEIDGDVFFCDNVGWKQVRWKEPDNE